MHWIDQTEKVGRLVLWLALSSACVLAPISYIHERTAEAEREEAAKAQERADAKAEAKAKEAAALAEKASKVLPITSMGSYMTAIDLSTASGSVWFTNASARAGVVCVEGSATNEATKVSATSLVGCHEVGAYASAVRVPLMFAGGDLRAACPSAGACVLTIKDVPASG